MARHWWQLFITFVFVTLLLLFQLSFHTNRINALIEKLYSSKPMVDPQSDVRILIVGLVASLDEMNHNVSESLAQLCSQYTKVEIFIVHGDADYDDTFSKELRHLWEKAGCHVSLVSQETLWPASSQQEFDFMNRFQRLALLRSLQRLSIVQRSESKIDVVMNLDLDITHFPPLDSLVQAIHNASTVKNSIACANGYETWHTPWGKTRLYYDTLAAIDANGTWWYRAYAANLWQIITFGQARLFARLLRSPETFKMQSCFGGLAIYDYDTWSTKECDYANRKAKEWNLSTDYMLPGEDACEHVVFQQCLRHFLPQLEVGIQPTLLVGRDAALFSTQEAKVGLVKILGVIALVVCASVEAWKRRPTHWHSD